MLTLTLILLTVDLPDMLTLEAKTRANYQKHFENMCTYLIVSYFFLFVSGNGIGEKGVAALTGGLVEMKGLRELHLASAFVLY